MLVLVLFMQAATPATRRPAPTPTPRAPIYEPDRAPEPTIALPTPATRTLSDVARERRGKPKPAGSFSASGLGSGPPPTAEIDPSGYLVRHAPTPTSASPAPASEPGAKATPSTLDKEETHWRARNAELRGELARATKEYADIDARLPHSCNCTQTAWAVIQAQNRNTLAPYQLKIDAAQVAVDRLGEECRAAGCNPGWVR
jgi:hypothetical protein